MKSNRHQRLKVTIFTRSSANLLATSAPLHQINHGTHSACIRCSVTHLKYRMHKINFETNDMPFLSYT